MALFDENLFEIERNLRLPPPLDPHIASLTIRTGSNNPADYFDLSLSASLGQEVVTLISGEEEIEVNIAIRKAEIVFDAKNATFHLTSNDGSTSEGWSGNEKSINNLKTSKNASANISVPLSGGTTPSATLSAGLSTEGHSQGTRDMDRLLLPWRIIDSKTIQLGYLENFEKILSGRLIDENISIRVSPVNRNEVIGVLGRIRVRSTWLELTEISPKKIKGTLKLNWDTLLRQDAAGEKRRQMFSKLLAHLVQQSLQSPEDNKSATLAASAIVFSPISHTFSGPPVARGPESITIDPTSVERFLSSKIGEEQKILKELGVPVSDADAEIADKLINFLISHFRHQLMFHIIHDLPSVFRSTLGVDVEYFQRTENREGKEVTVTSIKFNRLAKPSKTTEIFSRKGPRFFSPSVGFGFVRGNDIVVLARILGFEKSVTTLRKRISPFVVSHHNVNIITIFDLAQAIGEAEKLGCLVGRQLNSYDLPINALLPTSQSVYISPA